jgi:copper chaperone CopZ
METIKLAIPNMKSSHCQMTVTNTVENIGATVKSIAPAQAEIGLANGLTKEAVVQAIEKAGYKVVNG